MKLPDFFIMNTITYCNSVRDKLNLILLMINSNNHNQGGQGGNFLSVVDSLNNEYDIKGCLLFLYINLLSFSFV